MKIRIDMHSKNRFIPTVRTLPTHASLDISEGDYDGVTLYFTSQDDIEAFAEAIKQAVITSTIKVAA